MTEQELKAQRTRARANWELLKMKQRSGLVSPEDVATAEKVLQDLLAYQLTPEASQPAPEPIVEPRPNIGAIQPEANSGIKLPSLEVSEFARILEELTLQKSEAHKQMCICCNKLKDIPDNESAKELVDEIDQFYKQRTQLGVKVAFLKANGRLPEEEVSPEEQASVRLKFLENLPVDKYELSKQLANTLANLSKARKSLFTSKDQVTKVKYSQKVAKLEAEVGLIRSRMKAMD